MNILADQLVWMKNNFAKGIINEIQSCRKRI